MVDRYYLFRLLVVDRVIDYNLFSNSDKSMDFFLWKYEYTYPQIFKYIILDLGASWKQSLNSC